MKSVWPNGFYRFPLLIAALFGFHSALAVPLHVGVPDNPPLSFKDSEGYFQGVYVEVIQRIAEQENWKLYFESISVSEGLNRLRKGDLDMLINVPYNATYRKLVDFSKQGPVLEWGLVAAPPGHGITSVFDLHQKSIALPARDEHSGEFQSLCREYGVDCRLVPVETYAAAARAVASERADVAAVSSLFLASEAAAQLNLQPTPITFHPSTMLVAAPRNVHGRLLKRIDETLAIWKQEPDSFLYRSLDQWTPHRTKLRQAATPLMGEPLMLGVLAALAVALFALAVVTWLWLRSRGGYEESPEESAERKELRESEQRYRGFVENIPFGLLETDTQGGIQFANAMEHQIRRYKYGELIGKNILDMVDSLDEREKMKTYLQRICSQQPVPVDPYLTTIIRQDGTRASLRYEWTYKRDPQGDLVGLYALVTDVTETLELKNKILDQQKDLKRTADQRANDLLKAYNDLLMAGAVFDNTSEAILVMDLDYKLQAVNPAFSSMTGFTEEEVEGQKLSVLASKKLRPVFFEKLYEHLRQKGSWQGEVWPGKRGGEMFPGWLSINSVRDAHEHNTQFVAMLSDITKRKQYEQQIWRQANFDALTGLPNRNLFHQRLSQAIQAGTQGNHTLALMFIDLDKFKEVNDTLGHDAGDELLKSATRRISGCVDKNDTVARMGGDEFTVILPAIANERRAALVAGKILEELNRPFDILGHLVEISGSIGIVLFPQNGKDLTTLLKNADIAMYHIKESGRNDFCFYSEVAPQEEPAES